MDSCNISLFSSTEKPATQIAAGERPRMREESCVCVWGGGGGGCEVGLIEKKERGGEQFLNVARRSFCELLHHARPIKYRQSRTIYVHTSSIFGPVKTLCWVMQLVHVEALVPAEKKAYNVLLRRHTE